MPIGKSKAADSFSDRGKVPVNRFRCACASGTVLIQRRRPVLGNPWVVAVTAAAAAVLTLWALTSVAQSPPVSASSGSLGCHAAGVVGEFAHSAVDGQSRPRTFLVNVPTTYAPSRPYPLVFVFHGSGGDAKQSSSWGLQHAPGAAEAAIFVFPSGIPFQRFGVGWDDRPTGYDLPFFDNMLKSLAAGYCVDLQKVFVAGFSWGGDFVVMLACQRGDAIRAAAANSSDDEFGNSADYLTYRGLPCPAHRHPAIRFEHAEGGDASYPAPLFATTSQLFRFLNQCSAAKQIVPSSSPATSCVAYSACSSRYVECTFDKRIGHSLPPNWASETWNFFASFR